MITPHPPLDRIVGRPGATETSNEFTRSLPCVMSLRLLDSKDGPIASQLAPFAKSYDVSHIHEVNPESIQIVNHGP